MTVQEYLELSVLPNETMSGKVKAYLSGAIDSYHSMNIQLGDSKLFCPPDWRLGPEGLKSLIDAEIEKIKSAVSTADFTVWISSFDVAAVGLIALRGTYPCR
jgi:hypothetical protein